MPKTAHSGRFVRIAEGLYRYSSSGTYFAVIRHLGKLIRRSLQTQDFALAKRRLADLRRSLERVDFKAGKVTVAGLAARYMETVGHLAANSLLGKRAITRRIVDEWPEGSAAYVRDVRESHVRTWLSGQGKRVGKSAYNSYVQHLRAMFRLAVADRIIAESPMANVKQLKRDLPIRNTPTVEEFEAILASIRAQRLNADSTASADFVEFLGLSGLGNAEASSLTWGDVDFAKGKLRAYRHKTDVGFMVPIFPQLRPLLERLRGSQARLPGEKVLAIADAKKSLTAACQRLKLAHYSHRSFRRMFITRAIERGVDVQVIASWQGHRDGGKLILQTYSHVRQLHADEMAKLLK